MTEHRPDDPVGNLVTWRHEWMRVHPAVRWMVAYWFFVATLGGLIVGFFLGVILA